MAIYRYTPLDERKKEIRLVTLLAGSFSDMVKICIHKVSFSSDGEPGHPEFEALSYAWGLESDTMAVSVSPGVPGAVSGPTDFTVADNLALALPSLRQKTCKPNFVDRCYLYQPGRYHRAE